MKNRFRRNGISVFKVADLLGEDVEEIKLVALFHFKNQFQEHFSRRPKLSDALFKDLSPDEKRNLELPFTLEDIKEVVWSSIYDKIPGLDDFNMSFYKVASEIIKFDLKEYVNKFFQTMHLA